VLNPLDGGEYNRRVVEMLTELFRAAGVTCSMVEFDIIKDHFPSLAERTAFDGYIIPGSTKSATDDFPWIQKLCSCVRELELGRVPIMGICFGHTVIAQALGGRLAKSDSGLIAAACSFNPTADTSRLLKCAAGGSATLLYLHDDIVIELPSKAKCLGSSPSNPIHGAAYFGNGSDPGKPHILTFQAHPEFSTPAGNQVLRSLLLSVAPDKGAEWVEERVATIGSEGDQAVQMFRAAVSALWPDHF